MLTTEEILALPAGWELNAVVARLKGLLVEEPTLPEGPAISPQEVGEPGPWYGRRNPDGSVWGWGRHSSGFTEHYSIDWAHAGPLLEEMELAGVEVMFYGDGRRIKVHEFGTDGLSLTFGGGTPTERIAKAWCLWRLQQQKGATG